MVKVNPWRQQQLRTWCFLARSNSICFASRLHTHMMHIGCVSLLHTQWCKITSKMCVKKYILTSCVVQNGTGRNAANFKRRSWIVKHVKQFCRHVRVAAQITTRDEPEGSASHFTGWGGWKPKPPARQQQQCTIGTSAPDMYNQPLTTSCIL